LEKYYELPGSSPGRLNPEVMQGGLVEKTTAPSGPKEQKEGEGHFLLNIAKIVFLVAVLVAFWYFFDKWLGSK